MIFLEYRQRLRGLYEVIGITTGFQLAPGKSADIPEPALDARAAGFDFSRGLCRFFLLRLRGRATFHLRRVEYRTFSAPSSPSRYAAISHFAP